MNLPNASLSFRRMMETTKNFPANEKQSRRINMKYGSDKEVQAVTLKLKEQRLFEKTDSALELERAYSLKLMELGNREVKMLQRRLKSRVSKIKSYLTAEEIKEFRKLELQGKFKPLVSSVQVSGAYRIAAASKRLKLQHEQKTELHGPKSAHQLPSRPGSHQVESVSRFSQSASPTGRSRTSSSGTQAPSTVPRMSARDNDSVFDDLSTIPETPRTLKSARTTTPRDRVRPATSVGVIREKVPKNPRSKSSVGYSSHEATEKENRDRERERARPTSSRLSTRRASVMSDSSLDGELAKERQHEFRQMLIEEELANSDTLQERQHDFLDKIKRWTRENHAQDSMNKLLRELGQETTVSVNNYNPQIHDGKAPQKSNKKPVRKANSFQGRVNFRRRQDGPPLEANWKELNKCRYLRISNEQTDLSGVVTLAKEQMRLFQSLRKPDYEEDDE